MSLFPSIQAICLLLELGLPQEDLMVWSSSLPCGLSNAIDKFLRSVPSHPSADIYYDTYEKTKGGDTLYSWYVTTWGSSKPIYIFFLLKDNSLH